MPSPPEDSTDHKHGMLHSCLDETVSVMCKAIQNQWSQNLQLQSALETLKFELHLNGYQLGVSVVFKGVLIVGILQQVLVRSGLCLSA